MCIIFLVRKKKTLKTEVNLSLVKKKLSLKIGKINQAPISHTILI